MRDYTRLLRHVLQLFALLLTPMAAHSAPDRRVSQRGTFVVLGEGRDWLIIETHSHRTERLTLPPAAGTAESMAVAPDNSFVVFTSFSPKVGKPLLYRWDKQATSDPVLIGDHAGHHADPALSADGRWVYFAHHPTAGGPAGAHERDAFAQIYRVKPDGTSLGPVSTGIGCHFSPTPTGTGGDVFYVHANCGTPFQSVEVMHTGNTNTVASLTAPIRGRIKGLSMSADGTFLLLAIRGIDTFDIDELSLVNGHRTPLFRVPRDGDVIQLRAGAKQGQLFYLRAHGVWFFDGHTPHLIAQLAGSRQ